MRPNGAPTRSRPSRIRNEQKGGLDARRTAARLLGAVIDARTPLDALTDSEHGHPQYLALDGRDRSLVRAILVSALRYRGTIEELIRERLQRPLPANARALSHILHTAAAQILFLDIPDRAAVDLAVTLAKTDPRTSRFSGLVNAVLRKLAKVKEDALPNALAKQKDAPEWFIRRLEEAWGRDTASAILAAHRQEPPTDFTVKSDPQEWAERLGGRALPNGSVRVDRLSTPVPELPGFAEGQWWVQDTAASLPVRLLGNVQGIAVADLCAAPGGKSMQLAQAGAQVTAVDLSSSRLRRLKANLQRVQLEAEMIEADILSWQPDRLFDAVLLDAPCSSTGTVRRHPDVPWTKTPEDIEHLAKLQDRLLRRALTLVRPGGVLVFSNCSLDPAEGEDLVDRLLEEQENVMLDPIRDSELPEASHFLTKKGYLRTTPAVPELDNQLGGVDGFFAARLRPRSLLHFMETRS